MNNQSQFVRANKLTDGPFSLAGVSFDDSVMAAAGGDDLPRLQIRCVALRASDLGHQAGSGRC